MTKPRTTAMPFFACEKKFSRARGFSHTASGFTLFEAIIALGIFAIAFTGLIVALDTSVQAGIETRRVAAIRRELDNRLAYCLVDPPIAGDSRITDATNNRGFQVEETLEPFEATNQDGNELSNLWLLKITVQSPDAITSTAETLLFLR